jgi:hypothetical protein
MSDDRKKERLWPDIIYFDEQGQAKATKSLDLPFREGFKWGLVSAQTQFMDKVLAQAKLPEPSEWSKIVAVQQSLQSVRRLIQHSPLEMNSAVLFTTLMYSRQSEWRTIIKKFFKECGLDGAIPLGRPRLSPSKVTALCVGKLIEEGQTKLVRGWAIKAAAKKKGGVRSGDEQITMELRARGYDNQQVTAILAAHSSQDAACRYFEKIQGTPPRDLKTIRNIYWQYRNLKTSN